MNLQENIRRILRENRKPSNFLRRRLGMLDYEVESKFYEIENRVETYSGIDICVIYDSGVRLFETIMENSIDAMYYNYFSHIDDNSGEWAHEYLDMVNYIRNKYQHKIMKYYDDNCGSGSIPIKESIRRILKEELNKPSEKSFEQALKDVMTLIPLISHRILHDENMEHNEETVVRLNKMILQKVKEGNDEVLDEMWEIAGSMIMKHAINIITHYTK